MAKMISARRLLGITCFMVFAAALFAANAIKVSIETAHVNWVGIGMAVCFFGLALIYAYRYGRLTERESVLKQLDAREKRAAGRKDQVRVS